MSIRLLAAPVLALSLAACSGGTGGKVSPVIASGPPPASMGELAGTTFPLRLSEISNSGGDLDTTRMDLSVEVVSDTELLLTTPDGVVELTLGAGVYSGSLNGVSHHLEPLGMGFDYSEGWFYSSDDGMGDSSIATGYFGFETPQTQMDNLATGAVAAAYHGDSFIMAIDGGVPNIDTGTANLFVDFGAGTVTGNVYETATIQMSIEGGTISGNGIDGTLGLAGPDSVGYTLDTGDVDGQFFGVNGDVLHGTFGGSGVGPSGDVEFVGSFHTID